MARPRIGITTSFENDTQKVAYPYIRAIEQAGGLPMIVPVLELQDSADEFTALLEGLVITGGPAITRGLIGEIPPDLEPTDPARTRSDELTWQAMQDRPVLGICYGMQFVNAQAGGTIYADVQAQRPGSITHSSGRGGTTHPIQIAEGSHLRQALGTDQLTVNTYHIQAVAQVGEGLRAVAFGPDGVIEAVESTDGRVIGVQFHPERMFDQTKTLFEDFVARCKRQQR